MKSRILLFYISLIFFLLFMLSCGSKKNIVYFQDTDKIPAYMYETDSSKYIIRITPNDNLSIRVSAANPQSVEIFNLSQTESGSGVSGYLVDEEGYINFPVLGRIKLAGLTKSEAVGLLENKISKSYAENPIVSIRFTNYKITILGEVKTPGTYVIENEKVSLPEIIAMAGDMTINGERKEVLICRVISGEKQFFKMDMTSPEIFFSPHFFLQQNDIVYVQPNKAKVDSSSSSYRNIPFIFSIVTFAITMIALFSQK